MKHFQQAGLLGSGLKSLDWGRRLFSSRRKLPGFRLLLAGLLLFSIAALRVEQVQAEQVKDLPKPTDYVSDLAHVLSPQAVAELDNLCSQLDHSKANSQIAVVTGKDLDGEGD